DQWRRHLGARHGDGTGRSGLAGHGGRGRPRAAPGRLHDRLLRPGLGRR
ncbi:MAG: hypothetical protein AVDCRST_MAG54-2102, partial [uncultured Actinomycetospora sp.]